MMFSLAERIALMCFIRDWYDLKSGEFYGEAKQEIKNRAENAKNILVELYKIAGIENHSGEVNKMVDRDALLRIADEMDAHWLGHDGMEDSPVARWSRGLREALGEAE